MVQTSRRQWGCWPAALVLPSLVSAAPLGGGVSIARWPALLLALDRALLALGFGNGPGTNKLLVLRRG